MTPQQVIEYFGNQACAAAKIGVSVRTIGNWVFKGTIPRINQLAIETISKGHLKADK